MGARERILAHAKKLAAISAAGASLATACNSGNGYAVVDPLPNPPPRCSDIASKLGVTASFVTGDSGALVLRVQVSVAPGSASEVSLATVTSITAAPSQVLSKTVAADAIEFEIDVPSEKFVAATLSPIACDPGQGEGTIRIALMWGLVSGGAAVTASITSSASTD